MTKLMLVVVLMVASVTTSVATGGAAAAMGGAVVVMNNTAVAKVSVDTQTVNSLVVMIEKEVKKTCRDRKTMDRCHKETTAAIDKYIMAAAGQSQKKFWKLFVQTAKIFNDRIVNLYPVIKKIPVEEITQDANYKMFNSWTTAIMAMTYLRVVLIHRFADITEKSGLERSPQEKALINSLYHTR